MNRNIQNFSDEEKILLARAQECIARSDSNGVPEFLGFLSDRERQIVLEAAARSGVSERTVAYGGYDDAERCIVGFFPDYFLYLDREELIAEFPVSAVEVKCSGFREHTHRDFLGSVLGLGLERSVVGDIIVGDKGYAAVLFVHSRIADFLCENLRFVGHDGVRLSVASKERKKELVSGIKREFEVIHGTCVSLRLDAVISEILGLSREKSQKLVSDGLVSVNHEITTEKDRSKILVLSDAFTVRGYGKFRLSAVGDINRRGRIRFEVQKFI